MDFQGMKRKYHKVVHVTNMYPTPNDPSKGVFVKNIVERTISLGFNTDLIAIYQTEQGVASKIKSYLSFYMKIVKSLLLNDPKYTLFYIHFPTHSILPFLLFGRGFDILTHFHGSDAYHVGKNRIVAWLKKSMSKLAIEKSLKVIVPSNTYRKFIIEKYRVKKAVLVFPSGGVRDFFQFNKPREKRSYKFAYIGRLEKQKNFDLVMDIFRLLRSSHPTARFLIVGNGSMFQKLNNTLLKNDRLIDYKEGASQTELVSLYNDVQFVFYPSMAESLGLVPLEALKCGCIPLVSDIEVFRETLVNFDTLAHSILTSEKFYKSVLPVISKDHEKLLSIIEGETSNIHEKFSELACNKLLDEVLLVER
ncbi:TPA: glycosyltransferase family 4 protein [Vibrio vulnificus]|nr:glycosyltransferase family 4 protein [Vibrio vulnificus]